MMKIRNSLLEIDPLIILKNYGLEISIANRDNILSICPFHKDTNASLSMDRNKGIWYCFGCGIGGDLTYFIELMEGVPKWKALLLIRKWARNHNLMVPKKIKKQNIQIKKLEYLDESFLDNFKGEHIWLYTEGFREQTIKDWELGYCPILNAISVPVRAKNKKLVGIIYRKVFGLPKYIYMRGFAKSQILFGIDKFKGTIPIIVEGAFDVIWLHQWGYRESLSILGSMVSNEQALFLSNNFKKIIVCLDNDNAGRLGTNRLIEMLKDRIEIYLTKLPNARKDIRECSPSTIRNVISHLTKL